MFTVFCLKDTNFRRTEKGRYMPPPPERPAGRTSLFKRLYCSNPGTITYLWAIIKIIRMPTLFFLILGLYLTGNFYIFFKGAQALASYPTGVKVVLSLLFWSGAFSLIFTFMFRKSHLPLKFLAFTHETGSAWLVFTLYMVLFLLCFDLIKVFYKPFIFGFHLSFACTLCLLSYGYYNYKHPEIKTADITIDPSDR